VDANAGDAADAIDAAPADVPAETAVIDVSTDSPATDVAADVVGSDVPADSCPPSEDDCAHCGPCGTACRGAMSRCILGTCYTGTACADVCFGNKCDSCPMGMACGL
jgi:hypothetical protein